MFPDDTFADLFGFGRGRQSVPADVVASVMVLQALEGCRIVTRLASCSRTSLGRSPPGDIVLLSWHDAELVEARRAWRDGDFTDG